jgi:hypothetical protein
MLRNSSGIQVREFARQTLANQNDFDLLTSRGRAWSFKPGDFGFIRFIL